MRLMPTRTTDLVSIQPLQMSIATATASWRSTVLASVVDLQWKMSVVFAMVMAFQQVIAIAMAISLTHWAFVAVLAPPMPMPMEFVTMPTTV